MTVTFVEFRRRPSKPALIRTSYVGFVLALAGVGCLTLMLAPMFVHFSAIIETFQKAITWVH